MEYAQSWPDGCCSVKQPYQACRLQDWFVSLTARWGRLPLESNGGPSPVGPTPSLRSSSAAKDPSRFIATGEYLLVAVFVAGHHRLGRELPLHPGPHHLGVQFADPGDGGSHLLHRGDDKPVSPSATTSGTDPLRQAITGVPQAMASVITSPNGSAH